MPREPHADNPDAAFVHPSDLNTRISRYLKSNRFESLINERGLFFTRIDRFHGDDPFEGSIPRVEYERLQQQYDPVVMSAARNLTERYSLPRTMINCWHMNPGESAAMWKLHCAPTGVCVQSTVAKLSAALAGKVRGIGMVSYIDYETEEMAHSHPFYSRFMHKSAAYAHEAEVRAVQLNGDGPLPDVGVMIEVDLSTLIEAIIVAPSANDQCVRWAARLAADAGLNVPVHPSTLAKRPNF